MDSGYTRVALILFIISLCPKKKHRCLINNRTKVFCLTYRISSILNIAYLHIDFEITIVDIRLRLREIYHAEVENSKFFTPNFGDF